VRLQEINELDDYYYLQVTPRQPGMTIPVGLGNTLRLTLAKPSTLLEQA
jgi:hypothetical protein